MTRLLPFLCAILALTGCATSVSGPATFRNKTISFAVPARWKASVQAPDTVFVEDSENAIAIIQGQPANGAPELKTFAANFSRTAARAMPFGSITSHGLQKFTDPSYGPALREKVTISLGRVSVPHTRTYRERAAGPRRYYLLTQVSDQDAPAADPGFREILRTFSAR